MKNGTSFKKVTSVISKRFNEILAREKNLQSYLNRVVYRQYQNLQNRRWMTEGASEGSGWKPLNPAYAKRKAKKFASYPGGGRKMLIATGRLFDGVVGQGDKRDHRKITTQRSLRIMTTVPYAQWVDEARTFTRLGAESKAEIRKGIMAYLAKGKQ